MEAVQKMNLTDQGDTGPYRKLMDKKDLCEPGTQQEDSNYVDLDDLLAMKTEGTKTVKVTFTGEGSQLAIFKCNSEVPAAADREQCARSAYTITKDCQSNNKEPVSSETVSSPDIPDGSDDFRDCIPSPDARGDDKTEPKPGIFPPNYNPKNVSFESEELHYTDMYLNKKSESEDSVSVVLSDNCTPSTTEDESHYITTHEIQLLELDHDVDYDVGQGSRWDIEDDNLVYSFVDYASFDSEETIEEGQGLEERSVAKVPSHQVKSNDENTAVCATGEGAVSAKHDLCDSEKFVSSDESLLKNPNSSGNSVGQIHLSIKATSRAINEQRNIPEKKNVNGYIFKSPNTKAEAICDRANCFIPAPGRVHIGSKLKGKDINEYSSGASSSISELDDADKEVRNLTTRAFRSLACPYFNAINFSTSSESSASEHGLGVNRWSAFVDLKYGNMAQGREQNLISHKSSTSTFELNKNAEAKGMNAVALANLKTPQTKIFALNSTLPNPNNTQSSSTKKIELKGKFGQGQSGVITLTETLNFRCNVQAGVSSSERRAKFAENVALSHSIDEVAGTLQSDPGVEESNLPCDTGETMEDAHKKSIFASSLLKNVISKKMQFEQERKMERGEIQDTYPVLSPCNPSKDQETQREKVTGDSRDLQRENSKFSEAGSGFSIVSLDELGDIIDSNSCELKDDTQKEEPMTFSPEANLNLTNEVSDSKKGTTDATKSTLHHSQNSAFRSWREDEQECQKEQENSRTPVINPPSFSDNMRKTSLDVEAGSRKPTKMSHLFVPSIQLPSKERELGKPSNEDTVSAASGQEQVNHSNAMKSAPASRSPEIKISLRSVKDGKRNPFNIANLLTPNIGSSAAGATKPIDDSKCQTLVTSLKAESTDKVPSFTVRDIRDNKWRLQPPIYQVRDVRKLVKSSYHFVSLDNQENKSFTAADSQVQQNTCKQGPLKSTATPSPIVIKCQSVNTNSNLKQSGNLTAISKRRLADAGVSCQVPVEGTKNGTVPGNRTTGRVPPVTAKQYKSDQSDATGGVKKDKVSDAGERKSESKTTNQAAIEKLKAAVKTMEQLYVFDRNEWKRKTQAPRPVTDSHVLSLITSEEQVSAGKVESEGETGNPAGNEKCVPTNSSPTLPAGPTLEESQKKEDKGSLKTLKIPCKEEKQFTKSQSHQGGTFRNKDVFSLGSKNRATATISGPCSKVPTPKVQSSSKSFVSKAPKVPLSLKISQTKPDAEESEKLNGSEADRPLPPQPNRFAPSESENYLTIPVKTYSGDAKPAASSSKEPTAIYSTASTSVGLQDQRPVAHSNQGDAKRLSLQLDKNPAITETRSPDSPTATIYHHSLPMTVQGAQPQVFCFSPSVPPATTPSLDPFQQTQRKMLLDPTTGHYYLVDTPVHPATRRLFDPETGQYVDVPVPQQCITPVPMPVSPLALSPGAYGPTYIYYPGFVSSSAVMTTGMDGGGDKSSAREAAPGGQPGDAACWESPYYNSTGRSAQGQLVPQFVKSRVCQDSSGGKPVISITSQQGPRIIAPPSFDGTTMSFVVEHR